MNELAGNLDETGDDFAPANRGRRLVRGAVSVAAVPVFLAGLYFAAATGIRIADQQGTVSQSKQARFSPGVRWGVPEGAVLVVADAPQPLREHDFQKSSSDPKPVPGTGEQQVGGTGWVLEVLPDGDRRYLRVKWVAGDREGDEFWLAAKQLEEMGVEEGG